MIPNNSPLEYFVAFLAAFFAGALVMLGLGIYAEKFKREFEFKRQTCQT